MGKLRQWIIVLLIYFLGEFLSKNFSLPIPGNIMGMILLFTLLATGTIKLEKIEGSAKTLLDNLAFLFIPAGVGLMNSFGIISASATKILFICIITTFIVMASTGVVVQFVANKLEKSKAEEKVTSAVQL